MGEAFLTRLDGPAPETEISRDLLKRGLLAAPVLLLVGLAGWGVNGLLSVGYGLAIVLVNFLIAAAMMARAARISVAFLMGAALGGFFIRMGLIVAALLVVINQSWVEVVPLTFTLIVAHLGLLAWETRHVSASLAFPGLKPKAMPARQATGNMAPSGKE